MTNKQVESLIAKKLEEAMPAFAVAVAAAVRNQETPPAEEEPVNESEALSADDFAKFAGSFYKTPVVVDGNDEVAYVMHYGQDMATGIPTAVLNSECEVVTLPDGDYAIKVGDAEHAFNVVNGIGTFAPAATNEETPETEEKPEEEKPEEDEKPVDEQTPDEEKPVDEAKPVNKKPLPKPNNLKVPVPKNTHAKALHEMFAGYGPGCVGNK